MNSKHWTIDNPVEIDFRAGAFDSLAENVPRGRVLLVTSNGMVQRGTAKRALDQLGRNEVELLDNVSPNPDVEDLDRAVQSFRGDFDMIVALGGGSAIDTAKALSAGIVLARQSKTISQHLAARLPLPSSRYTPIVAIPTTSGTGSEVTPFATVWDLKKKKKMSLESEGLFAQRAIVDPLLTQSLPKSVTISTGLDALSQGLESIWNKAANPVTIALAQKAVRAVVENIVAVVAEPNSLVGRTNMMMASLLSGFAISKTRTAIAHSISYPLTAELGIPHGIACSFMLPEVLQLNASKDDGRLLDTARMLNCHDCDEMARLIGDLLVELDVMGHLLETTADLSVEFTRLIPEMYHPDRAANCMARIDFEKISEIIRRALHRLDKSS
jgi:alcohol dehydrogenase